MDTSLNGAAASATLHCLTGCAIGEVLGMVLSTIWGWAALPSVALAVALAFLFGYLLSMIPLLRYGLAKGKALRLALLSDTASIATIELIDNLFILTVPGAIHASLASGLFWWSLLASLGVAFMAAFPLNRYLIARGKGHAVVHALHHDKH
jgi:uncharacterized membrane protein (Fun14 family)